MVIDEVHTKTCQNIQSALSGYYAHEADFYQETASLPPHVQQVIHKALLYAVNMTISNFLFMLADHEDDPSRELRDEIGINQNYVDSDGNRTSVVGIDSNLSGAFSVEWKHELAKFKEKIEPESPRRVEFIKVFLSTESKQNKHTKTAKKLKDTSVSLIQQQMEDQLAIARRDGMEEGSMEMASCLLSTYFLYRFPENHRQWVEEVEPSLNGNSDTLLSVCEIAFQCDSFQEFVKRVWLSRNLE